MVESTQPEVHAFDEFDEQLDQEGLTQLEDAQRTAVAMFDIKSCSGYPIFREKMNAMRQVSLELGIYDKQKGTSWYEGYLAGLQAPLSLIEDMSDGLDDLNEELKYWKDEAAKKDAALKRRMRGESDADL